MKKGSKIACTSVLGVLGVLFVGVAIATPIVTNNYDTIISSYFNQRTSKVVETSDHPADSQYFKSAYSSTDKLVQDGEALCQQIVEEGTVLLKNENKFLPLSSSQRKVSFFGLGSANFLYSGGGSGGTATSDLTLKNTFEAAGFSVNPTLWDFYAKSTHKRDYAGLGSGSFKVDEVPQSEYTEAVKASYASYADVAIVVVTRVGSEGIDLATDLAENPGHGYLAQTPNEKALIEALQANDTFSNIIVIANTTNAIELGWINQYSKIKACLTLAGAGQTGLKALPRLLTGEVNPSAHLVDTWAYDSLSAPSALNFGDQAFTNSDKIKSQADSVPFVTQFKVDLGNKYTVYQEGIYIGYRYYETRYEDVVNGLGNPGTYDYQSVVQYPFGYGLSYTSFEETLTSVTVGADTITYKVHVKNTGSVAGKDVVEAYFQSPYTSYDQVNGIEKSAIELCGFAKTALLAPNEESDVSISVEKSELRSYNAHWNSDKGGYIVDGGDYYFAIGEDVHDALNNILAKKGSGNASKMTASGNAAQAVLWNNPALDETTYHNSAYGKKAAIENQFKDADINYYDGQKVTYLSRSNWTGTYPTHLALAVTDAMIEDMKPDQDVSVSGYSMPTLNAKNGTTVIKAMGKSYDDPVWAQILDNLSFEEMARLIHFGGYRINESVSIAYNQSVDKDGPAGLNANYSGGNVKAMAYPSEVILAQTWNVDLASKKGEMIAEDAINGEASESGRIAGWYGPACDIHRSPYSGRNFEYFSEDPFLSGFLCKNEVKSAVKKGLIVYVKHFALNDQETNRIMLNTFANEQSIREIYLESFEKVITEGDGNGIMTSLNKVGCVYASSDQGLINNVLRNEWGFEGICKTDYCDNYTKNDLYYNALAGIKAGTDTYLNTDNRYCNVSTSLRNNAYVVSLMREACHHIFYSAVNSIAMNGTTATSVVVSVTPEWKTWRLWLEIGLGVLAAGCSVGIFFLWKPHKAKPVQA